MNAKNSPRSSRDCRRSSGEPVRIDDVALADELYAGGVLGTRFRGIGIGIGMAARAGPGLVLG